MSGISWSLTLLSTSNAAIGFLLVTNVSALSSSCTVLPSFVNGATKNASLTIFRSAAMVWPWYLSQWLMRRLDRSMLENFTTLGSATHSSIQLTSSSLRWFHSFWERHTSASVGPWFLRFSAVRHPANARQAPTAASTVPNHSEASRWRTVSQLCQAFHR